MQAAKNIRHGHAGTTRQEPTHPLLAPAVPMPVWRDLLLNHPKVYRRKDLSVLPQLYEPVQRLRAEFPGWSTSVEVADCSTGFRQPSRDVTPHGKEKTKTTSAVRKAWWDCNKRGQGDSAKMAEKFSQSVSHTEGNKIKNQTLKLRDRDRLDGSIETRFKSGFAIQSSCLNILK